MLLRTYFPIWFFDIRYFDFFFLLFKAVMENFGMFDSFVLFQSILFVYQIGWPYWYRFTSFSLLLLYILGRLFWTFSLNIGPRFEEFEKCRINKVPKNKIANGLHVWYLSKYLKVLFLLASISTFLRQEGQFSTSVCPISHTTFRPLSRSCTLENSRIAMFMNLHNLEEN